MAVAPSLIPGLDDIVREGDPKRLANTTKRIAELFLAGAAKFRPDHVDLFDGILLDLVPHTEPVARAELAERLSLLVNAPRGLVGRLAREDEVAIAGPLLRRSPVIDDVVLIEIARLRGQGHLLAMSERPTLSSDLTDVIVRRGDRDVVRSTARNAGAAFSQGGYSTLVKRASHDGVLTLAIGQRDNLSASQLKELIEGSIEIVRRRLFDMVKPERQAEIKAAISELSGVRPVAASRRNFVPAQQAILALHAAGELNEAALFGFARSFKYEESIAALSAISAVKIATLDDLISGERHDPILIIGKTIGLEWATVRALILLRLGPNRIVASADIENARLNFNRLMPSTAERVVSFWKTRQPA
jgi:uncharacterized protein (DUF2336 family)